MKLRASAAVLYLYVLSPVQEELFLLFVFLMFFCEDGMRRALHMIATLLGQMNTYFSIFDFQRKVREKHTEVAITLVPPLSC